MSTIAFRDGIMATDSRAYAGYNLPLGSKSKMRRLPCGGLVGVSTREPGLGEAVMDWMCDDTDEMKPPESKDFTALWIEADGAVYFYTGSYHPAGPITAPFFAIGSGAEAALGAMHMGATAAQAVEVACQTDVWTGMPVHAMAIQEKV